MTPPDFPFRSGPFRIGDQAQLTDPKGRMHTITLEAGKDFHTAKGAISHDEILDGPEGVVVSSTNGTKYLVQRPLLKDFVLSMPRGATVIYPKDAAMIVGMADIYPGATVIEAGAGSGAMTCSLLRAVGDEGRVHSYERREDFAEIAAANVQRYFGREHPAWEITVGDLVESINDTDVDRVILDMLAPWECVEVVHKALRPGGVVCIYVATTTQMSRTVEAMREYGGWTEPESTETLLRSWHVEGLAVRPNHRMVGHTGFLITARRLADGVELPPKRTRPSKGAYGQDWQALVNAQTQGKPE
ncbi:MAG: tRNA (adenine-N1)-methyltransferase [Candidatus Nanopelagicales bacterium]